MKAGVLAKPDIHENSEISEISGGVFWCEMFQRKGKLLVVKRYI
jgi:hypothetical protein